MLPTSCECAAPGFCSALGREMRGRDFEVCRGVNVDLGTAALVRMHWMEETVRAVRRTTPRSLTLVAAHAPGDTVALTAAIYSLHRANPGVFRTAVDTPYPEVFAHNPDVAAARGDEVPVQVHYPAVHHSGKNGDSYSRGVHFMQGYCEFLSAALGVNVPLLTDRPRLYFGAEAPPTEDFWVVCSGGKRDLTNKLWDKYQDVVDALQGRVRFAQVGATADSHSPLRGAENLVGKTSLRELFDLVRRCRGVLCGVSLLMHVAAALEKPAVVVAGGREPVPWNAYPRQQYVHTVGSLPCCAGGGCWKSRVQPLGDGSPLDSDLCERPVERRGAVVPACMDAVTAEEVTHLVERICSGTS